MFRELNIKEQCNDLKVPLLECPHFLFVLMGLIIITSMIGVNVIARYYTDPELAALVVITVTAFLFVIGHIIVRSFERVAEASRARIEFISIISHQLRNPLSSIRWQLELVLRDESISAKIRSYLESANEYNNRMAKLVNDLLAVNRIESNRLLLTPVSFSLAELTQKVIDDNKLYASASHMTLELREKKNTPLVYADKNQIRWAVENLVSNAIRYSNPRTVITITIEKQGKFVRLEILNRGIFITPEDTPYVFKKFFRAGFAQRSHTDGSGLGLFIAKSVVEASEGIIGFNSNPSGETTFWFTLPRSTKQKQQTTQLLKTNTP